MATIDIFPQHFFLKKNSLEHKKFHSMQTDQHHQQVIDFRMLLSIAGDRIELHRAMVHTKHH